MFVPKTNNQVQKFATIAGFALFSSMPLGVLSNAIFHYDVAFASPVTPDKLIELTNVSRVENGLPTLVVNSLLTESSQMKSNDMYEKNYFAHTSPEGKSPWYWFELVGYDYIYAGENLAKNYQTAESMHQAWMDSPTHRANILSPNFKEIGIAIAGNGTVIYATQHFGTRDGSPTGPSTVAQASTPTPPAAAPVIVRDTTAPTIEDAKLADTSFEQGEALEFALVVSGDPTLVTVKVGEKSVELVEKDGRWTGSLILAVGGEHTIVAIATDAAGNAATKEMGSVTVNLPVVERVEPDTRSLIAQYWQDVATNEAAPISLALIAILLISGFAVLETHRIAPWAARLLGRPVNNQVKA